MATALLATLAAAAFSLLLLAPTAQAGKLTDRWIGGSSTGVLGGQFNQPRGVAVHQASGRIYVADANNHRIQRFSAEGDFERAWGVDVVNGVANPGADGDTGTGSAAGFEICTVASECKQGIASGGNAADNLRNGAMNAPRGLAVNQSTGHVYVKDNGNFRVNQYTADGEFIRSWGWDVDATVAGTGFEICPAANRCKSGLVGNGEGQFAALPQFSPGGTALSLGVAVHPGTDDVIVADPGHLSAPRRAQQFTAAGAFVAQFGDLARFGTGSAQWPRHVAVDADGVVYASNLHDSHRVDRYDSENGEWLEPIDVAGVTDTPNAETSGLAIDPGTGHLLVSRTAQVGVLELDVSGADVEHVDTHVAGVGLQPQSGLAVNVARDELLISSQSGGHRVYILDDDGIGTAPVATIDGFSNVTASSATVRGRVNPTGTETVYRFEYSVDGRNWTLAGPAGTSAGDGTDDVEVEANLTGLTPNTAYRVRLVATYALGMGEARVESSLLTDAISATATTVTASSITDTSALLVGRVNPNGSEATYQFQYGLTTSYGNSIPVPAAMVGSGTSELLVSQQVTGLVPNATYHYRIVADNGVGGMQAGADRTFTTKPAIQPPAPDQRAYELVSPADKVGGQGIGDWYNGPPAAVSSAHPAYEGERSMLRANLGGTLLGDAATAYASDLIFAERKGDQVGWKSHSPITHPASGSQRYRFLLPDETAPDLSKFTLTSNAGLLRFFPEQADWSESSVGDVRMIGDWDGRWEIFGPTDLSQLPGTHQGGQSITLVSADGSHVVGSTEMRGLAGEDDPALDQVSGRSVYVHDSSAGLSDSFPGQGERTLLHACNDATIPNRLSSGKLDEQDCPDADGLISGRGADIRARNADMSTTNLVSEDGSRIFFLAPDPATTVGVPISGGNGQTACSIQYFSGGLVFANGPNTECPAQLYVRERQADGSFETRWISKAEDGLFGQQDASLLGPVRFEAASPSGDKVLFRTNSPLTADDPNGAGSPPPGGVVTGSASNSSWDLYLYDLAADELTRISAGPTGAADCNSPVGGDRPSVRFASDDLTRVYFVCAAPLSGAVTPSNGTITSPGGAPSTANQANLYLYDANRSQAERWRFVARLPRAASGGSLSACATTGSVRSGLMGQSAVDSGRPRIRFQTNCVRGTADGAFITFFTDGQLTADDPDATSGDIYGFDAAADELTRITAPQGGSGGAYICHELERVCHGDPGFGDPQIGTPSSLAPLGVVTHPQDGARIAFFQSKARLVSEHTDHSYQVYQWRNGELSLLTPGSSNRDGAFYMGNDRTGQNVYFATRDPLTWQDHDVVLDLYTARMNGGIPEPVSPPSCAVLTNACQPASPTPPAATSPVSRQPQTGGNVDEADPGEGAPAPNRCVRVNRQARRAVAIASRAVRQAKRAEGPPARRLVRRARVARKRAVQARRQAKRCRAQSARAAGAERRHTR